MNHVLLLAGGSGTRFWPKSRKRLPKQFLSIIGEEPLIVSTINRMQSLIHNDNIWVLGNNEQRECMPILDSHVSKDHVLLEPYAKNTAACIGWGLMEVLTRDPDAVVVILPADAWIQDTTNFQNCIRAGIAVAEEENCVVTLGVKPKFAHTGYGYIEVKNTHTYPLSVKEFKEKPNKKTAEEYISKGSYYWNAGIFIGRASFLMSLFSDYMPNHYSLLNQLMASDVSMFDSLYSQFDSISIDYGIMEKIAPFIKLIPASFDWNDIGSWSAISEYLPKDEFQNAVQGNVLSVSSSNNLVYSQGKKLIVLADVDDLAVVDSDDALLIFPKKNDQIIKRVYQQLDDDYK